jgi:hypothetical protein
LFVFFVGDASDEQLELPSSTILSGVNAAGMGCGTAIPRSWQTMREKVVMMLKNEKPEE